MAASSFFVPSRIDGPGGDTFGVTLVREGDAGSGSPTVPTTGQIWPRGQGT